MVTMLSTCTWPIRWDFKHINIHFLPRLWHKYFTKWLVNSYGHSCPQGSSKENPARNYWPLSLTCLCCKVMEHIVLTNLNKHLSKHYILSHLQHGFCSNLSCETQLILTFHDWANTLNQRGQVDALLLDFSKAFNKVSHTKLLHKLAHCGINGKMLAWSVTFLHDRTQFVVINGTHSTTTPVTSGVPPGSILGQTLFLLFINDITQFTIMSFHWWHCALQDH